MTAVKHNWPRPPASGTVPALARAAATRPGAAPARQAHARARTVLVPIDYSEPSRRAFELACRLAGGGAARLTLVHVPEPPRGISLGMADGPPLPVGYRGAGESRLSLIRPSNPAVPVEHRIEEGDPAAAILRAAERTGSDLIVMGTYRKRGFAEALRRSVSRRVSRRASCPVLKLTLPPVRASEEGRPPPGARDLSSDSSRRGDSLDYRTILHPTDFSKPAL